MVSQEIRDAALRYSETKCFMRDGQKYEIKVNISFDDDCNNKSFDFSVTGEIVRITKNGHRINDMCGCIHDEILRYFPKFASFVEMHCRNREGMPMHPFANGFYHLTKGNTKAVMEDWWITEEDGEKAVYHHGRRTPGAAGVAASGGPAASYPQGCVPAADVFLRLYEP